MNHDNPNDVQPATAPKSDPTALTTESFTIKRELTDGEIASVVGGLLTVGPNPPHKK